MSPGARCRAVRDDETHGWYRTHRLSLCESACGAAADCLSARLYFVEIVIADSRRDTTKVPAAQLRRETRTPTWLLVGHTHTVVSLVGMTDAQRVGGKAMANAHRTALAEAMKYLVARRGYTRIRNPNTREKDLDASVTRFPREPRRHPRRRSSGPPRWVVRSSGTRKPSPQGARESGLRVDGNNAVPNYERRIRTHFAGGTGEDRRY